MNDNELIKKITELVRDYGTDYQGKYKSINLGNQELSDPNKTAQCVDYNIENDRTEITFEWFDEDTGEVKMYCDYPIKNLDKKDLAELYDLVEFSTADLRPKDN